MHTNTYLGQRQRKMVHTIKNTDLLIYNTLNKMKKLELIDINKSYDTNVPVLKNVSFSVENGEFLVLLGPSGCGKSTILSIIAGFEKQNDGNIIIDGRNCDTVSCQNRDIAMVFQNYALYPNMNVYNNIAFPLVNRREKKEVIKEKVITISKMLQIEDILGKKVDKISGGQKQRVAIGRALVKNRDRRKVCVKVNNRLPFKQ